MSEGIWKTPSCKIIISQKGVTLFYSIYRGFATFLYRICAFMRNRLKYRQRFLVPLYHRCIRHSESVGDIPKIAEFHIPQSQNLFVSIIKGTSGYQFNPVIRASDGVDIMLLPNMFGQKHHPFTDQRFLLRCQSYLLPA